MILSRLYSIFKKHLSKSLLNGQRAGRIPGEAGYAEEEVCEVDWPAPASVFLYEVGFYYGNAWEGY